MKKLIALLLMVLVVGCEGNTGPQGPLGENGQDGVNIVGQGFEVNGVNFNADNDYSQLFYFDEHGAEALDTDVVVGYLKYGEDNDNNVWQQLPATYYLSDGSQVQYGFDHTLNDVNIFLGGNTDFSALDPVYTDNQTFRIAILQVDYVQSNNIDMKNMNEVMSAIGKNGFKKVDMVQK